MIRLGLPREGIEDSVPRIVVECVLEALISRRSLVFTVMDWKPRSSQTRMARRQSRRRAGQPVDVVFWPSSANPSRHIQTALAKMGRYTVFVFETPIGSSQNKYAQFLEEIPSAIRNSPQKLNQYFLEIKTSPKGARSKPSVHGYVSDNDSERSAIDWLGRHRGRFERDISRVEFVRELQSFALSLEGSGRLADAIRFARAATDLSCEDPGALVLLGDLLQAVGQKNESSRAYSEAIAMDPASVIAWMKQAKLTADTSASNGLVSFLKDALYYNPSSAELHAALAAAVKAHREESERLTEISCHLELSSDEQAFVRYLVRWVAEDEYYRMHPDVRSQGLNAYLHFLTYGLNEARELPGLRIVKGLHIPGEEWTHFTYRGEILSARPRNPASVPAANILRRMSEPSDLFLPHISVAVDIIIPVYRGYEETQACIKSVIEDAQRPESQIIVINDRSPDARITQFLKSLSESGKIRLLENTRNLGFVASVNRALALCVGRDVVLLNSDTVVPSGWLKRLSAHAHSADRIGTVTPLSNNATICSYPNVSGGELPAGFSATCIDLVIQKANRGASVEIPTAVGFAMYIRRDCLDEIGSFDAEAFGKGYGEENDFCVRATKRNWRHLLAGDTYVYHRGEVSFGAESPHRKHAWNVLVERHPEYPHMVESWSEKSATTAMRFSATAGLLRQGGLPVILLITHRLGGGVHRHIDDLVRRLSGKAAFVMLRPHEDGAELSFPVFPGHPALKLSLKDLKHLKDLLTCLGISRVHVHHLMGFNWSVRELIESLAVPFDFSVHDYFALCPRVSFFSPILRGYCGEPTQAVCNRCIREDPPTDVSDITTWRIAHRWLFQDADRVLCPSKDVQSRLKRFGLHQKTTVLPGGWTGFTKPANT